VDSSAEPDVDSTSEADESVLSDPSVDAASAPAEDVPAEDVPVDEDVADDEESPVDVDETDGSAYAMPGVVAMATPTPRVTANAPTRPMCLA
jgi:hypothetical protein